MRAGSEVGEPDAFDSEVAEDLQVRLPEVRVTAVRGSFEQLSAELTQRTDQELADRQPVGREIP